MSRKIKLAIYKPYDGIWFKNPIKRIIKKDRLPNKYEPFFNFFLNDNKTTLYLTTGLIYEKNLKGFLEKLKDIGRMYLWLIFNNINIFRVNIICDYKKLNKIDYTLVMYYGNISSSYEVLDECGGGLVSILGALKTKKILHMTHYFYNTISGQKKLHSINPDLLIAENNLAKNAPFFREVFGHLEADFYTLPYVPGGRFKNKKTFSNRKNKAAVTGNLTFKVEDSRFLKFFDTNQLHPMRRILYEEQKKYRHLYDCFIVDLDFQKDDVQSMGAGYKINISDVYNDYMMFVIPEEVSSLPSIGFIECMACGAAFIGLNDPMYTEIGLIPGYHYIAYDGSLEGLVEQISFHQKNLDLLEKIATQGNQFAIDVNSAESIYGKFRDELMLDINASN